MFIQFRAVTMRLRLPLHNHHAKGEYAIVTSIYMILALAFVAFLFYMERAKPTLQPPPSTTQAVAAAPQQRLAQGELVLNLGTEPPTLDPARMTDLTSFQVYQQLMEGLVVLGNNGEPEPGLASHWQIDDTATHYTLSLRPNLHWSDGQPLTAQHVADGMLRALSPQTASPYATMLYPIKGAEAYNQGKLKDASQVGISVLNARTLQLTLAHPVSYFLSLLSFPVAMPVRTDVLGKYGAKWLEAGNFISSGAWVLAHWQHNNRIILRRNPHYHSPPPADGSPWVQQATLLMVPDANTALGLYQQGALDVLDAPPALLRKRLQTRPDANTLNLNALFYLGFNISNAVVSDVRIRKALALCINRPLMAHLLQNGATPLAEWVPPAMVTFHRGVKPEFSPQQAKALLAEAGYPNGGGLPTLTLGFPSKFENKREAEILQEVWRNECGINVRLANQEWKQYLAQLATHPPDIFRLSWYADYPDPDTFFGLLTTANGNNYTRWTSPVYDALVTQASQATSLAQRKALYTQAEALALYQAVGVVPLYSTQKLWLRQPWVKGLTLNPMNGWMLNTTQLAF
jgi:oligopeptide transport system substrate-binding protein